MVDWFVEKLTELFKGEWEEVGRFQGECRVGNVFSPRHSVKSDALVIIERHSLTKNLRGYIQIPTGTTQNLSSKYVEDIYERRIKEN